MSITSPRKRSPISKPRQVAIFRRDLWLCQSCQRPVIFAPAMRLLGLEAKQVASYVAYHHAHWTRRDSPLLDELGSVIDHVHPHSKDGDDADDNLCTSCNKCNGRKGAALNAEWEIRPKRRPIKGAGEPEHWDGMTSIFVALARRYQDGLTSNKRAWLAALLSGAGDLEKNLLT